MYNRHATLSGGHLVVGMDQGGGNHRHVGMVMGVTWIDNSTPEVAVGLRVVIVVATPTSRDTAVDVKRGWDVSAVTRRSNLQIYIINRMSEL